IRPKLLSTRGLRGEQESALSKRSRHHNDNTQCLPYRRIVDDGPPFAIHPSHLKWVNSMATFTSSKVAGSGVSPSPLGSKGAGHTAPSPGQAFLIAVYSIAAVPMFVDIRRALNAISTTAPPGVFLAPDLGRPASAGTSGGAVTPYRCRAASRSPSLAAV